jgi:hypothetical protein
MGIDRESDLQANLQIGPTSLGMVRIYVEGEGFEIPMDFEPEEAEEIADEIRAAAESARAAAGKGAGKVVGKGAGRATGKTSGKVAPGGKGGPGFKSGKR